MNDNFPKLKVIPINKLILHEKADESRVKKLVKRIKSDSYFRNPIIAVNFNRDSCLFRNLKNSEIKTRKFFVLDGVHRVKALERLGCRDIVAQIVDYFDARVKVNTWDHLLFGCGRQNLFEKIRSQGGISVIKAGGKEAIELLKKKKIIGYFLFKNGDTFLIKSNNGFEERTEKLLALMDICETVSEVDRISKSDIPFLLKKDTAAVLVIPNYNKKEIVNVALRGLVLPAGVTRHIIPNRVLGLDINLAMLKNNLSLSLKNKLLEKFINKRIKDKRIRFYSESVFIFDE
jgi:hypothetical protein